MTVAARNCFATAPIYLARFVIKIAGLCMRARARTIRVALIDCESIYSRPRGKFAVFRLRIVYAHGGSANGRWAHFYGSRNGDVRDSANYRGYSVALRVLDFAF